MLEPISNGMGFVVRLNCIHGEKYGIQVAQAVLLSMANDEVSNLM